MISELLRQLRQSHSFHMPVSGFANISNSGRETDVLKCFFIILIALNAEDCMTNSIFNLV